MSCPNRIYSETFLTINPVCCMISREIYTACVSSLTETQVFPQKGWVVETEIINQGSVLLSHDMFTFKFTDSK